MEEGNVRMMLLASSTHLENSTTLHVRQQFVRENCTWTARYQKLNEIGWI